MTAQQIADILESSYPGLSKIESEGNLFFMYDPKGMFPFATIMTNSQYDKVSQLDQPGRFRFNLGISKEAFNRLFPTEEKYDYAEVDRLMPHPDYGSQYFICVVNPSDATFEQLKPMIDEAYQIAIKRFGPKS